MAKDNVEVIRKTFEAWNAGDFNVLRDAYDPDAVMRYQAEARLPERGPFFGRDAIMRQFNRLREPFDDRDELVIRTIRAASSERVLAQFAWKGVGRGPAIRLDMAAVYTLREGLIREVEFFIDYDSALEAAGLSD